MKKIILLLLFATLGWQQADAQVFGYDGLNYQVITTNTVHVIGYSIQTANVTIPAQVTFESNQYRVTAIYYYAFVSNTALISVTIPDTVTNIYDGAFSGCTNLTSITCKSTIPPNVGYDEVFEDVDILACSLIVPAGTVAAYISV